MHLVPRAALSIFFFVAAIIDECELLQNKHKKQYHAADFHRPDCTVILDNSANVHVIGENRLSIYGVKPCPIGMNVGTVTGSNSPQVIGMAQFYWLCNDGHSHFCDLEDALYYPSSPVNVKGVTKLATDNNDHSMNV